MTAGAFAVVADEAAKLGAFARRDFLSALSYRAAFITDSLGLIVQAFMFSFIGRLIAPSALPAYGSNEVTYLEFVTLGIAVGMFVAIGLAHVATVIRSEQLMGTLESLLMTPTSTATVQLGSVAFDLVYVPIRTGIFVAAVAIGFGLDFRIEGVLPAVAVLCAFIPVVWGLGLVSAAAVLTFRRGTGLVGVGSTLLTLGSTAYVPLELLPGWIEGLARVNPLTITLESMRDVLLGSAGWGEALHAAVVLTPAAAVSLAIGMLAFRLALSRERRLGTMGQY